MMFDVVGCKNSGHAQGRILIVSLGDFWGREVGCLGNCCGEVSFSSRSVGVAENIGSCATVCKFRGTAKTFANPRSNTLV